jgi:hypothetical protein
LVRAASKPVETLIYYQKRREYIGGNTLRCNIVVREKFRETVLMLLHSVTFTPQSDCSVEKFGGLSRLSRHVLASRDVLGYKASGPAPI